MEKPYRVLLVDDHPVIRQGIRQILDEYDSIQVVGEAANGLEAIQQAGRLHPDIIIMDIEMPIMDGLDASRRLIASRFPSHILILSGYAYQEFVDSALQIGVDGFLLKDDAPDCLFTALRRIAAGEKGLVSEKIYVQGKMPDASTLQPCDDPRS